jgi:tRNA-dihydrouridine synthase C
MIGQDLDALLRTMDELQEYPIAGIDLNLGCPAPVVCKKEAGGGLLRNLPKVDLLLGRLRDRIRERFTVKTRIGYDSPAEFTALLEVFARHGIDALAIHGRTVRERYQTAVHPECIRQAVAALRCPVIANGNVVDVATGLALHRKTGAAGLMIGRGAIRNPWIFDQLRAAFRQEVPVEPSCRDQLDYVRRLYDEMARETVDFDPLKHVQRMKKTMVFVTQGHDPAFEHRLRRAKEPDEFHGICREFLDRPDPLPERPAEDSRLFCGFSALAPRPWKSLAT